MKKPVALIILDGWGLRADRANNAPALANTPHFDALWSTGPRAQLSASGPDVGLPEGQIGNSEVGHLNIGAGRVVLQTLPRINAAIASGEMAVRSEFLDVVAKTKAGSGRLHLMGLMSPGGVHSHQFHIAALAKAFVAHGLEVLVHAFTDGRDTAPNIALQCYNQLLSDLDGQAEIVSVCGRYLAMDRDQRWQRTGQALSAIRDADAPKVTDLRAYVTAQSGDEFIEPCLLDTYVGMQEGDGLACANFRADRVRQILRALLIPETPNYRALGFSGLLAMAPYAEDLDGVMTVLFKKDNLRDTLAEVVAAAGRTQFHIAETEKYPHVTFFLNGGQETPFAGEDRTVVPSPKVATYDLAPQMSAAEVSFALNEATKSGQFDLLICNFANPDMVGHTGDLAAAIAACESVDQALGTFLTALDAVGGQALITADHGNCEVMWDDDRNGPHTAHTLNPVPLVYAGKQITGLKNGRLADLAPSLLDLMNLPQPAAMTGQSLIERTS